jgi:peptide chain release factor 2
VGYLPLLGSRWAEREQGGDWRSALPYTNRFVIENTESRSQFQNKENAMRLLKSHLYELELRKRQEGQAKIEGKKMKIEWGSQIRNYVLHPYKLVKDLRSNYETSDTTSILDGDLNDCIKSYLMQFGEE